ncbi:hypothetical protein [Candidatus Hecatella orcuttiae]|jgi:hypothetical protein|uniref:hypothetical protein n=1 Tax=Candidatus Hecatella orcuttiae TaxID=1935119 RepID=UPI002867FE16|nr:hypothetical protein [Candidatus Hecatella orcuttiae]
MRKPSEDERKEIRRLIIEKLVMGRNWGRNYIAETDIPKGLPKCYPTSWYKDEVEKLAKEGLLQRYKKPHEDMFLLNKERKREIETIVGGKVPPKY